MTKRISASLSLIVDLKVGDHADIKNLISRLDCSCIDTSGEDAKIIDVRIIDRKLLVEGDLEE
ncbi:MAG TPA: hypothetical protein VJ024_00985 [Thermodesulfovibrionales bacterium]|nr:hypothetical protein [Thermodesulfovibrionales bacterium]